MINNEKSIQLYQAIKEANERRVFESWHASSIADCPRAHYYKRLGIKPLNDPSAALMLRWKAGHAIEEAIRPFVETVYGKAICNKRYYSKKYDSTGEFDNLIIFDNRLVEVKSVHDNAFIEREGVTALKEQTGTKLLSNGKEQKTWALKETPYLGHELQNHNYVLILEEHNIHIKYIDYLYVSLSGRIVVYSTEVQEELKNNVKARLKDLNEAWRTKTPPKCICHESHPLYSSVMCYCNYKGEDECCSLKLLNKQIDILPAYGENSDLD